MKLAPAIDRVIQSEGHELTMLRRLLKPSNLPSSFTIYLSSVQLHGL
jgi:hypothetical protein